MADYESSPRPDVDINRLRDRIWEQDLLDFRGNRVSTGQDWKKRLRTVDSLYSGRWTEVFPDESVMVENPHVMNLVQTGLDDISKLTAEAVASNKCAPAGNTEDADANAQLREAIADTYWARNSGELLIPSLTMDIAGAGGCFLTVGYEKDADDPDEDDYPVIYRIDPRFCYPDVRNGKLLNLLVVETLNKRIAARMFPSLGWEAADLDATKTNQFVELLHYYEPGLCLQAVAFSTNGEAVNPKSSVRITRKWTPKNVKGEPIFTVAAGKLDTFDGAYRGMFDQVTGSLQTKNRMVKQLLDYTDEVVYAERYSKGLLNPEEPPGPMAHYRLDPQVADAVVGRVPPAASAPQVFQILDFLDREQRGSVGYPTSRQGEISQSIASATFVASTQGQLTTTVRNIQRIISNVREQINSACFQIDEAYCNVTKPLARAIGKKKTYTPARDINGLYESRVIYGAAAGLDRVSADNRLLQLLGAGVIDRETTRDQVDFIDDPKMIEARIDMDATKQAFLQKLLADGDPMMLAQLIADQADGKSIEESAKSLLEQAQQAQPQPGAQPGAQPGGPPGPEGMPPQGGQGGALPEPGAVFAPPPAEQIQIRNQPGRVTQLR